MQTTVSQYEGKVRAPEFPDGLQWLNTERPLTLKELRGKVVILDFWTYACINCQHVIPELKRLEKKYGDKLVVIGIHSAKFLNEQQTEHIRQAILRHEIEHPVVNDNRMTLFSIYGARAWPTLMLIDPEGKILTYMSGEDVYDTFDPIIARVIEHFEAMRKINHEPLGLLQEREKAAHSLLSFPGKVVAHKESGRLFIADSNHNRIVVTSLEDGTILNIVGSGEAGLVNGDFSTACFNHPQGMAFDGAHLYVADTENHAVREINFLTRIVTTIAGTGIKAAVRIKGGPGSMVDLNSPWDVLLVGRILYIAMAGLHQIWRMDLNVGMIGPFAGSGREDRIDGPLKSSALAQPSGLATDGKNLYVADSEVSAIRSIDLDNHGMVETVAGGELFDFGDVDAVGLEARFQHPLGVVYYDGNLYVADTFNHKIKVINPETLVSQTFAGTGKSGFVDDFRDSEFYEPGGISAALEKLYVADTNNHAVRIIDIETVEVSTFEIKQAEEEKTETRSEEIPEENGEELSVPRYEEFNGEIMPSPEVTVESGEGELIITMDIPSGYHLNLEAPSIARFISEDIRVLAVDGEVEKTIEKPEFPLRLPIFTAPGETRLNLDILVYYCLEENMGQCLFKETRIIVPVNVREDAGTRTINLGFTILPER